MLGKIGALLLFSASAFATPVSLQQVEARLKEVLFELNKTQVELNILTEKVAKLQNQKSPAPTSSKQVETRLSYVEKQQQALSSDLSTLNAHLTSLETKLNTDLATLKDSLGSMLGLLQGEEPHYIVKAGDSLGEIALKHKVSLKELKRLNNLKKDTIFVGQKLKIPSAS